MGSFTVTSGSDTLTLDTAGNVMLGGQSAGSWSTNKQNQIAITGSGGVIAAIDATWRFNDQNQLTVQPAGQAVAFNFASDTTIRNSFFTKNAVMMVSPDKGSPFSFELRGDWNLDPNHNMTFTVNSVLSIIHGFVSDPVGRFIYHFANKEFPLQTSVLGFVGTWDVPKDANGLPIKSGDAVLVFNYKKEDGSSGTFQLPNSATIDHTTNQFAYTYKKDNKTLSINFQGTLMIDPNFQITYIFNRQLSSNGAEMVGSTTVGFDAMISRPDFTADLQLTLTKNDGSAGGTTLTIGGDFAGVLGKTKLVVGFSYQQTFGGTGALTRTAGFHGDLTFANGEIQWKFAVTGQTVTLAIGVDVKLGPVALDARLNLTMDHGQVAGVTFLLGVSF